MRHTTTPADLPPAADDIDDIRQRTIDSAYRALRHCLVALGRDYERCGKTICARSRRCRGFACQPALDDEET